MDINTLRGIATIVVMAAFIAVCYWVYVMKSKKDFDEAANLPFVDEDEAPKRPDSSKLNERATEE